ncbi:putative RNA-binding protein YlxR (DUF448 family) [Friedmanniella endophytica]|uniref:Putative RNA-binding protein YlxR (DUF448 family) n=1 Tax=Microlunatus kandeliicorticis TaxID=1759536 RepID=A0A7W3IW06_9ACTN|nr:YlxR family protein [Microlunatus kandeliicorticis]MBA8796277.1 putative RNA-binding protein YlxR (DUF448 family) [Microlunatus kandeliicorticis]
METVSEPADQREPADPREQGDRGATGPVRTCVGCRRRAAQAELVRVVAVDGRLVLDRRRRLPGRGAYLHADARCAATAVQRRAFGRALRVPQPDPGDLVEALTGPAPGA